MPNFGGEQACGFKQGLTLLNVRILRIIIPFVGLDLTEPIFKKLTALCIFPAVSGFALTVLSLSSSLVLLPSTEMSRHSEVNNN